jgi:hypothetical protein
MFMMTAEDTTRGMTERRTRVSFQDFTKAIVKAEMNEETWEKQMGTFSEIASYTF